MRITVRAKPGAKRPRVRWHPAERQTDGSPSFAGGALRDGSLEVAVRARAVEGAANEAVRDAVAAALGVRRSAVTIVRGHTCRLKLVEVEGSDGQIGAALTMLAQGTDVGSPG